VSLISHPKSEIQNPKSPIGIVAGWGRYPHVVADALHAAGHEVAMVAVKGHADPGLRKVSDSYHEVGLAKLGAAIGFLRRQGVTQATLAGKIHKIVFFHRFAWLGLIPDWTTLRTFYPHFASGRRDRKDDTLLLAVVGAFARGGVELLPATDFAPELLVNRGTLTNRRPTPRQLHDVAFGWELAKEMGRLDVGQSVAVKGRAVLAVEAVEGTDKCIARAGELCRQGGFTVVKVAKPQQDMRFDVPTIGIGTLKTLVAAGGKVLAVEAGKTILLDEPEVIEFANHHGLVVVALESEAAERDRREVA